MGNNKQGICLSDRLCARSSGRIIRLFSVPVCEHGNALVWEIVINKDGSVVVTFKSTGRDSRLTKEGGKEQNKSSSYTIT